jgi:hypothetical protein
MLIPLAINTEDDIKVILAHQTLITQTAQAECVQEALIDGVPKAAEQYIKDESKVLEKYARYPTLTEYSLMPNASSAFKWGATFGVTALVGILILDATKQLFDEKSDLKDAYLRYLIQLDDRQKTINLDDKVTKLFTILSEHFGIIWGKNDTISLTVVGRRVLLHLVDAQKFVEEIIEAHAHLQLKIPDTSI